MRSYGIVCMTALLCVVLGNHYGVAWSAQPEASAMLKSLSPDRWAYYLNNALPGDSRILQKLLDDKPRINWINISREYGLGKIQIPNNIVKLLIKASLEKNDQKVLTLANKLLRKNYG